MNFLFQKWVHFLKVFFLNFFRKDKCKICFIADSAIIDPEEESIYLCGNSLGLMPKAAKKFADQQFDKWAKMYVSANLKYSNFC